MVQTQTAHPRRPIVCPISSNVVRLTKRDGSLDARRSHAVGKSRRPICLRPMAHANRLAEASLPERVILVEGLRSRLVLGIEYPDAPGRHTVHGRTQRTRCDDPITMPSKEESMQTCGGLFLLV